MLFLVVLLAAVLPPTAPGNLTTDAAIVYRLPECSLGNGYDADKDGVIDTGCPLADQSVATGTGRAVDINSCKLAGTLTAIVDPATSTGNAAAMPNGSNQFSGQFACSITAAAGTKTLWIRAMTPNTQKTKLWLSTSPITPLTIPIVFQSIHNGQQVLNYTWYKTTYTFLGNPVILYGIPDDGMRIDCLYWDTNPNAAPDCPAATVPGPNPDYVILKKNPLPATAADAIWAGANDAPLTSFNSGVTGAHRVQMLWDGVGSFCILQTVTAASLEFPTAANDDTNVASETALWFNFRGDQLLLKDADTYRIIQNGHAPPALLDATWPSGGFSTAFNLAGVAQDRSYVGDALKNMLCATIPKPIALEQVTRGSFYSAELISGVYAWKEGLSPIAPGTQAAIPAGYIQWTDTAAVLPADATPPTVGAPTVIATTATSITFTFTVTDAGGSSCCTVGADWDSNSGIPYDSNVGSASCNLSAGLATCTLSNLTSGTNWFFRGKATDGAGNTTYLPSVAGGETNAMTVASVNEYFSATGKGVAPCDTNDDVKACPISLLVSRLAAGKTMYLRNGTYPITTPINISCPTVPSGTQAAPIIIRALNERQAWLQGSGTQGPIIQLAGCAWYVIQGFRVSGPRTGGTAGGLLDFHNSTNITVKRNLLHDINVWGAPGKEQYNTQGIGFVESNGGLLEENECYRMTRHCIALATNGGGSSNNFEVRRNYCNPTAAYSVAQGNCISNYTGSHNTFENNISENGYGIEENNAWGPVVGDNQYLGNIFTGMSQSSTIGARIALDCRDASMGGSNRVDNEVVRDNVQKGGTSFHFAGGLNYQVTNNSNWSSTREGYTEVDSCPAFAGTTTINFTNSLTYGSALTGFYLAAGTFTANTVSSAGAQNGANYSPASGDARYKSPQAYTPSAAQQACPGFIIAGQAPDLYTAGGGKQPLGAMIDYAYEGRVKTGTKFWNASTRQVNPVYVGVTIAGINGAGDQGLSTFGTRFHPSCALANFP